MVLASLIIFYSKFSDLSVENEELKNELAGLEKQWVKLRQKQGEIVYTTQKVSEIEAELAIARSEEEDLENLVEKRQKAIALLTEAIQKIFLKHRTEVWKAAKYDKFDMIRTPQGDVYENVTIIEVRPKEVSFMFGQGAKGHGLTLDKLPKIWIEKYRYTPAEVRAAQALAAARNPPHKKKP